MDKESRVRQSIQTNSSGDVVVMLTRDARCMVDDFLLIQRPHSSIQQLHPALRYTRADTFRPGS
jgi:hypothetical protein